MALPRTQLTRGIKQRVKVPDRQEEIRGPFAGTMQAGPARPKRAHGLSDEHQDRGLLYYEKRIWDDAIREFEKSVEATARRMAEKVVTVLTSEAEESFKAEATRLESRRSVSLRRKGDLDSQRKHAEAQLQRAQKLEQRCR